jgi:UDP-glucose 4-epimerase
MRTMVTGGAGFIGSALVDRLLAEGHEVDVVDDLSTGSLTNLADARAAAGRALTIHQLDVRLPETSDLVLRRRPAVIFHLAAQIDVRTSVADPVFDAEVNVIGSLRVLEGARAAGTDRVVFAASVGLYGEPDVAELPVRESHPHRPLSPYGVAKEAVIDYLVAYRELHALEFCALALGNVYGPRQHPRGEAGVVAIFAQALATGTPVTVFGDGSQTRDYVYVDDVVDAFARAATRGGGLVCNVGTGLETSVDELLATMGRVAGVDPEVRYGPARPGEILRSALDPTRAAIHLGWRPWTSLEAGTAVVIEEARRRASASAKVRPAQR